MIKDLIALANHLDDKGLTKEADTLDKIITKIAQEDIARIGKRGVEAIRKFLAAAYDTDVMIESFYNEYKPEAYKDLEMKDDEYGAFAVPPEDTKNIEKTVYTLVGCHEDCFDHIANTNQKIPTGMYNENFTVSKENEETILLKYSTYEIRVSKDGDGSTLICTASRADSI